MLTTAVGSAAAAQQAQPTARQLSQTLAEDPENRVVRWRLARVLFHGHRYDAARYHVLQLLRSSRTAADVERLTRALSRINQADPINVELRFSILPSTNVRRYTYNTTFETEIGTFTPVGDGQEESGIGLSFGGEFSYAFALGSGAQLAFGSQLLQRAYAADDLNSTQVTLFSKYETFNVGHSDGVQPYAQFFVDDRWRLNQRRVGIEWNRAWWPEEETQISMRLTGERRSDPNVPGNSGPYARYSFQYRTGLSKDWHLSLGHSVSRFSPRESHLAYVDVEMSVSIARGFKSLGSFGVSGSASIRDYDGTFPATNIIRRDYSRTVGMYYTLPSTLRLGEWRPHMSCSQVENTSNINLYDYRSIDCGIRFIRAF